MYQKNLQSHYNRHYGKAKTSALNSPSAMLLKNNKRMLEEDSDDEFSYSRQDQESKLKEQKLGSVMFLVTIVILLVKLFKLTSTSLQSTDPRQWWSGVKFPEFRMDWQPESVVKLLWPLLCGSGVAIMSWILIYFDSKVPGTNIRMPSKKELLSPADWPIAYWTSFLCGFFVFLTMTLMAL